jgi:hypothetical protein
MFNLCDIRIGGSLSGQPRGTRNYHAGVAYSGLARCMHGSAHCYACSWDMPHCSTRGAAKLFYAKQLGKLEKPHSAPNEPSATSVCSRHSKANEEIKTAGLTAVHSPDTPLKQYLSTRRQVRSCRLWLAARTASYSLHGLHLGMPYKLSRPNLGPAYSCHAVSHAQYALCQSAAVCKHLYERAASCVAQPRSHTLWSFRVGTKCR